ncbi:hypothetical protein FB45DRAFT_868108 [Roridomyces roridus]|uniref:Uncharacterized protein n=1 Tax=Roridomyces roridus TaxID=1738132 RepID=A0AAD7BP74_9AGAR|nr:hypothetical protein FB45DRAFT_868108 [Roridomyces roridus]
MQFNLALIASAILMAVSPVLGANFVWFDGARCDGNVIATQDNVAPNLCVGLANGATAKSVSYSGVPDFADFYMSGGGNDFYTNGATLTFIDGQGCAIAPDGLISIDQLQLASNRTI